MKKMFKIMVVVLAGAILPVTALAQTKPRITSPADRSSSILDNDVNVYVTGNNIEVIYAGLTGNPNPSGDNESNFYKGTMYQSGSRFFFTPNTSTWENKWVKIIAHDKVGGSWSDPVYVKIIPKPSVQPTINSFATNKSQYSTNEQVIFSGSASNLGSWKIVWLKNSSEADAATSIQNNNNISYSGAVTSTAYNGAVLYVYPQSNGSGTPVKRTVSFGVVALPVINSFTTNKSQYSTNEQVTFSSSASNFGSWKIVWLKNGSEADAATSIQNNSNISYSGIVTNIAYNGAVLYVYPQSNGNGTFIKKTVSFTVVQPQNLPKPVIQSITYEGTGVHLKGVYYNGTDRLEGRHTNTQNNQSFQEKYIDAHGNGTFDGLLSADKLVKGVNYNVVVVAISNNGQTATSDAWTIIWLPQPVITVVNLVNGAIQFNGTYSNGTDIVRVCHTNTKDNIPYWDGSINYSNGNFSGSISADKLAKGTTYNIYAEATNNKTGQKVVSTTKSVVIPAPVVVSTPVTSTPSNNSGNSSSAIAGGGSGGGGGSAWGSNDAVTLSDYAKIADYLNTGFTLVCKISGSDFIKLYSSAAGKIYIDGKSDVIKSLLKLDNGAGYYDINVLLKNSNFSNALKIAKISKILKAISIGTNIADIVNEYKENGDWGLAIARGSIEVLTCCVSAPWSVFLSEITKVDKTCGYDGCGDIYTSFNTSYFIKFGAATQDNFGGIKYISNINSKSGFRLSIDICNSKTFSFSIKYRSYEDRGGVLKANGVVQNIYFPNTFGNWVNKNVQIQLRKGTNTIEFIGGYQTENAPDIAEITGNWF